ncbi:MAG: hypothetical protein JSS20_01925 [Proteobacteria bacterium]|nr:hypothetical protein [Pseudomonadota bacterium]
MSSCEPRPATIRRLKSRGVLACAFVLTLAGLSGCADGEGFRPLYGPDANGVTTQEKMAKVDVAPIPSRVGQIIRNELIFQKTGGGAPVPPEYRLDITIRESINSTLVQTSGDALGQIYNLDAAFKLTRISDKKVVAQGTSTGRAGFERFPQTYSNVRATDDAKSRAAKSIADDIKTRLAATLSSNKL